MRRTLGMLGIAALLAAPAAVGFSSVAGASAPAGHVALVVGHFSHVNTVPNSNIKGAGKYAPKTLAAHWSASSPPASGVCKEKKISFSISNISSTTQTVTYDGEPFVSIPSGEEAGVCAWGTGSGSFQFGLQSTSKTLTVNES